jgi:hypothetical protein
MPGESPAVPTEDRIGLNHLQRSPPTGPESVQHNPQEPVAAVEAQATRRVLLENRKLVAKREYLRLQGSAGSKIGGYHSVRSENTGVPTIREIMVATTMSTLFVALFASTPRASTAIGGCGTRTSVPVFAALSVSTPSCMRCFTSVTASVMPQQQGQGTLLDGVLLVWVFVTGSEDTR